jgi:hypothetical protein
MEKSSIHLLEKERIFIKIIMMKKQSNNMEIHMEKKVNQTTTN